MFELATYENVFLATFLLLLLAVLTVEACRRDHVAFTSDLKAYLFRGRLPVHSLASNIGATFSVTYFFGAIVIYAQLFRSWFVLTLAVAFPLIFLLYNRLLARAEKAIPSGQMLKQKGNILLDLLSGIYSRNSFRSLAGLYLLMYFLLLVEELAVSRLVLSSLIPGRPLVVSFLLSVVCLVAVIYLYLGGFRAVLISDFVQTAVLCSFFLVLTLLTMRYGSRGRLIDFPLDQPVLRLSNLLLVLFLAMVWFLAGIDYSARFNFDAKSSGELASKRRQLAKLTALFTFATLSLGVLFSQALSDEIPTNVDPSDYVRNLAVFFLVESAPIYRVVFLVSVHCMIFTTIDTLLATLLQVADYGEFSFLGKPLLTRENMLRVLLAAAVVSSLIDVDRVHVVGIFIASLLILPAIACAKAILPRAAGWLPDKTHYLWWALVLSIMVFVPLEPRISHMFDYHFLLPGLPLATVLLTLGGQALVSKLRSTRAKGVTTC